MIVWSLFKPGMGRALTLPELNDPAVTRTSASQTEDKLTFTFSQSNALNAQLFAYGDLVTMFRGNDPWFVGICTRIPAHFTGTDQSHQFEISGPWWYLEHIVFQQSWKVRNPLAGQPGQPDTVTAHSSRVILCQAADGSRMTTGQQITEALQWAISCGAPIQIGTILGGLPGLMREAVDQTCAEVIRTMLRWTPDAICWFDYTTNPHPTIHIVGRLQLQPATLSLYDTTVVANSFSITPRYDTKVPSVLIKYEEPVVDGDTSWTAQAIDLYPVGATGLAIGGIIQTIELSGSSTSYQKQQVETAILPTSYSPSDAAVIAWFRSRCPVLQEFSAANLEVVSSSLFASFTPNQTALDADGNTINISDADGNGIDYDISDVPRELVRGTVTDWMQSDNSQLKTAKVRVEVQLSYSDSALSSETDATIKADAQALFHTQESKPELQNVCAFSVEITATNAFTQTYSTITDSTPGEAKPNGLAQGLYDALAALQYEGTITTVSQDLVAASGMGHTLNILDGLAEWTSMLALIQEVTENLATGERSIRFGLANHLSPQDFIELLRSNRRAVPSHRLSERTSAKSTSGSLGVSNSVGWTPGTTASNQPSSGGGASARSPFRTLKSDDSNLTIDPDSFIWDLGFDSIDISGLTDPFSNPSSGQKIYVKLTVSDPTASPTAELKVGAAWSGYPKPIVMDGDNQASYNLLIGLVVDESDDRQGCVSFGAGLKVLQMFSRNVQLKIWDYDNKLVVSPTDPAPDFLP